MTICADRLKLERWYGSEVLGQNMLKTLNNCWERWCMGIRRSVKPLVIMSYQDIVLAIRTLMCGQFSNKSVHAITISNESYYVSHFQTVSNYSSYMKLYLKLLPTFIEDKRIIFWTKDIRRQLSIGKP